MNLNALQKGVGSVADIKVETKMLDINLMPEIAKVLERTGKEAVADVKSVAPKRTGGYADSWTSTMEDKDKVVVYTDASKLKNTNMSTLLEKGHKAKNGKWVPPQEHIRPMYNRMKKRYEQELMRIKIESK